jgi:hypothetical protein
MSVHSVLSQALEGRVGRYVMMASAAAATTVAIQAAPITVILPTPVDVRNGFNLDMDQNGFAEIFFSGSGSTAYASYAYTADVLYSGSLAQQLPEGALVAYSATNWTGFAWMNITQSSPASFLGIRFQSEVGGPQRVAFAQFDGPLLYGYAWEQASSITTFDLRKAATADVPEPATGALAALALGALAVARRKKKSA